MAARTSKATAADRFKVTGTCRWTDSLGRVVPGEHGSTTQYGRALRVGATPCDRCRAANTERDKAWRRANPGKKSGTKPKGAKVIDHTAAQKAKAGTPGARQEGGTGTIKARKVG